MEKYNNAERQLDHYRMQATKISRIVPQKVCQVLFFKSFLTLRGTSNMINCIIFQLNDLD